MKKVELVAVVILWAAVCALLLFLVCEFWRIAPGASLLAIVSLVFLLCLPFVWRR